MAERGRRRGEEGEGDDGSGEARDGEESVVDVYDYGSAKLYDMLFVYEKEHHHDTVAAKAN